jgi:hypothetical protein
VRSGSEVWGRALVLALGRVRSLVLRRGRPVYESYLTVLAWEEAEVVGV